MKKTIQSLKYINASGTTSGVNNYQLVIAVAGRDEARQVQIAARTVSEAGWDQAQIMSDLEPDLREPLQQMVENFDKSGRMMMHEFGPVEADPPCFVPEKMRPISISQISEDASGNAKFRVVFEMASGTRHYDFSVESRHVGLEYEDHFYDDMGRSTEFALPLFKAVQQFYKINHPKKAVEI